MTKRPYHSLVAKLNAARVRRETLHGREYLVVPTTILRPDSVMNGSKGPLLYPRAEVAKNPGMWNGVPLLLNHPSEGTTGRDPRVLAETGLGYLYNDRVTNSGARVADAWFDLDLVKKHDADLPAEKRMLPRIEAGRPIDVSTGLYTDDRPVKNGVKMTDNRGRPFSGLVATNYRPDHLAVLPTTKGACSVDAGCGTHVTGNMKDAKGHGSNKKGVRLGIDAGLARSLHGEAFQRSRIASQLESNLQATSAMRKEAHESAAATHQQVADHPGASKLRAKSARDAAKYHRERAAFYTHNESVTNDEGDDMALSPKQRAAKVASLVANCECWKGKEKTLNAMDDDTLSTVHSQVEQSAAQNEALDAVRETLGIDDALVFNAEFVKSPDMKKKMKAACAESDADEPVMKKNKKKSRTDNDEGDGVDQSAIQAAIDEAVAEQVKNHPAVRNAERVEQRDRAALRARLTVVANLRTTPAAKKTLILNKLKDKDLDSERLDELLTLVGEPARNARHPVSDDDRESEPDYTGAGSGYGGPTDNALNGADDEATAEVRTKFASDDGMTPTVNWDNRVKEFMNGQRKGAPK